MRFTKLLAGTALIAMSTVSAHAVVASDSADICVGMGETAFEQKLSQQECYLKRQQAKMAAWNQQADARKQSIDDLNQQIAAAPADQKPALQSKLKDLQGQYDSQYKDLQDQNNAQAENAEKLAAEYKTLPNAEKARVQLRMNQQMVQHKLDVAKQLDNGTFGKAQNVAQKAQGAAQNAQQLEADAKGTAEAAKSAAQAAKSGDLSGVAQNAEAAKSGAQDVASDVEGTSTDAAAQTDAATSTDAAATDAQADTQADAQAAAEADQDATDAAPAKHSFWDSIKAFFGK